MRNEIYEKIKNKKSGTSIDFLRNEFKIRNIEELKKLIRNTSFVEAGKKFNISDNGIRKWCKSGFNFILIDSLVFLEHFPIFLEVHPLWLTQK